MRKLIKRKMLINLEQASGQLGLEMRRLNQQQSRFKYEFEDGKYGYYKEYYILEELRKKYELLMKDLESIISKVKKQRSY